MNANDIELALRSRATFNDSVDHIDADTRRRLRELRVRAQQGDTHKASARWVWPAGAALTAALALAVFLPNLPRAPVAATATRVAVVQQQAAAVTTTRESTAAIAESATTGSLESASSETPAVEAADPAMLSDLDFYGWLARQQDSGKTGG